MSGFNRLYLQQNIQAETTITQINKENYETGKLVRR